MYSKGESVEIYKESTERWHPAKIIEVGMKIFSGSVEYEFEDGKKKVYNNGELVEINKEITRRLDRARYKKIIEYCCLVEYDYEITEDGVALRREIVGVDEMRLKPVITKDSFRVNDFVDVFKRNAWCSGQIADIELYVKRRRSREDYSVFFIALDHSDEVIKLTSSEAVMRLRPCGNRVPVTRRKLVGSAEEGGGGSFRYPSALEIIRRPAVVSRPIYRSGSMVEALTPKLRDYLHKLFPPLDLTSYHASASKSNQSSSRYR